MTNEEIKKIVFEHLDVNNPTKYPNKDNVNHPSHYQSKSSVQIECIDAMRAAFGDVEVAIWCKLNAFKYNWRSDSKNGLEDIEKAIWNLSKFLELERCDK